MQKTRVKLLFIALFFSAAVPSIIFSMNEIELFSMNEIEQRQGLLSSLEIHLRGTVTATRLGNTIEKNDFRAVRKLLKNNANVNLADEITPLIRALSCESGKMAKLLLRYRANVNASMGNGFTPLAYARAMNRPDMVDLLLEKRANPHTETKYDTDTNELPKGLLGLGSAATIRTPLEEAIRRGDFATARKLIKNKAGVNSVVENKLLRQTLVDNKVKKVELLLEHGADVNFSMKNEFTPLTHARATYQKDIVDLLT